LNCTASCSQQLAVRLASEILALWSRQSPSRGPRSEGSDLHRSLIEKAGALGFALAQGQPFIDGNKRVAHAAMATFLLLNGAEIHAPIDEQERLMLDLASGRLSRVN
jgi:prophage maintenance system killer protein